MPRALPSELRHRIVQLVELGYSDREIVSELGIARSTIKGWRQRLQQHGHVNTFYSNCKRPSKLTDHEKESICLKSIENPFKSSSKTINELDLNVTPQTVNRILRGEGLNTYHAATKPKLNPIHRQRRIEFATFYENFDWQKCIFVDECCFSSEREGIKLVKRPRNMRYHENYVNYSDHCGRKVVSVWGAASYSGLGPLVYLDSRLNAQTYVEILDTYGVNMIKERFGANECFWVEDNCPAHRSSMVREWFEWANSYHGINVKLMHLPPYSPDLNPIENVWGEMKFSFLYSDFEINSIETMKQKILTEWDIRKSDSDYFKKLIDSLPERCNSVINQNGYPTRF